MAQFRRRLRTKVLNAPLTACESDEILLTVAHFPIMKRGSSRSPLNVLLPSGSTDTQTLRLRRVIRHVHFLLLRNQICLFAN